MIRIDIVNDDEAQWAPSEELCSTWLQSALELAEHPPADKDYELSLRLVNEKEIQRLNAEYRGKDSPTNVLSFPSQLPESIVTELQFCHLGDIAICPHVLEHEATTQAKNREAHWAHLLIHGFLHLLGYDHEEEEQAAEMEKLEIDALKMLGIPNPYLIG